MIGAFEGQYRFLSNFYPCPVEFEGTVYPTAEHAYQAAKSLHPEVRKVIASLDKPGQAKREGRNIPLREGWNEMRLEVMERILRAKFSLKDHPHLAAALMSTHGHELVEGNTWGDTYWGVANLGEGENHLGKLLMKIRTDLWEESRKTLQTLLDLSSLMR